MRKRQPHWLLDALPTDARLLCRTPPPPTLLSRKVVSMKKPIFWFARLLILLRISSRRFR